MATSLARQLKKLAAPQTQRLQQERAVAASLLFEPREASSLERDTFYSIGLNGLEELEILLPDFYDFRTTLFSESSKALERSVQTAEANKKLDKEINKFLYMVTPFMLLKPALKALEWLVNRFHIHLYNADSLMRCILPYHETKTFVRIVQLLDLKAENSPWQWLLPLQKAGIPLAKLTLFNHCASSNGFLRFICRIAKDYASCPVFGESGLARVAMVFYMSTVIGSLEVAKKINEANLATLVPFLISGFKSELQDYAAASHAIFSYLLQKMPLAPEVLDRFFLALLKAAPDDAGKAVQCLNVGMESQKLEDLSVKCKKLLVRKNTKKAVVELSQQWNVSRLSRLIIKRIFVMAMRKCAAAEEKSMAPPGHQKKVKEVLNVLRDIYINDEDVTFIIRHPIAFDETFGNITAKLSGEDQKLVQKLLCQSDSNGGFKLSRGLSGALVTSLHHPNSVRRKMAVEMLDAQLGNLDLSDQELTELVVARLRDDSAAVVSTVIDSVKLLDRLNPDELIPDLLKIICSPASKENWKSLRISALHELNKFETCSDENSQRIFWSLLPVMFPTSSKGIPVCLEACSNNILSNHPIFAPIWKSLMEPFSENLKAKNLASCHSLLVDYFLKGARKLDGDGKAILLKILIEEHHFLPTYIHFNFVILPIVLGGIVALEAAPDQRLKMSDNLVRFVATRMDSASKALRDEFDWQSVVGTNSPSLFLEMMNYDKRRKTAESLQLGTLVYCLSRVIEGLQFGEQDEKQFRPLHGLIFKLVTNWIHASNDDVLQQPFRAVFRYWIQICFASEASWFGFLLYLLTENSESNQDSCSIQIRCLQLLSSTVVSTKTIAKEFGNLALKALPFALAYVHSPSENVRSASLECLSHLAHKGWIKPPMMDLTAAILRSNEEIQCDRNVVKSIIAKRSSKRKTRLEGTHGGLSEMLNWIVDDPDVPDVIKDQLLECLENAAESYDMLDRLLPYLDVILKVEESTMTSSMHSIACQIVKMFVPNAADHFENSPEARATLLNTLGFAHAPPPHCDLPTVQEVALQQVTKSLFRLIPSAQPDLLKSLIDLQVNSGDPEIKKLAARVFRKLPFTGEQIFSELKCRIHAYSTLKSVKEAKGILRMHKKEALEKAGDHKDEEKSSYDNARKRMLVILEAIHAKRTLENSVLLIPILFAYLKRSLESEIESDYDKQLILMCLIKCSSRLPENSESSDRGQNQFNIELVIKCIRATVNPRIHHHALVFLSTIAKLFPEYVLHNAMAIFTFMGANVFRHDDSYSFNVITRTVESIIPPILENQRLVGDTFEERKLVTSLTRIFVDALPDIPEHRRKPLFKCYLSSLGNGDYLWLIIAVILQCYATWDSRSEAGKKATGDKRSVMDFARDFCHEHPPNEQIAACNRLIGHIVVVANSEGDEDCEDEMYLQLYSLKQRHHYLLLVVEFASALLSSDTFLIKVVEMNDEADDAGKKLYETLLRTSLECVHHFGELAKSGSNTSAAKYWKLIVHRTYELLDKSTSLVPEYMFVDVIRALVAVANLTLQGKAIEMLVAKLQRIGTEPTKKIEPFTKIIPELLDIIRAEQPDDAAAEESQTIVNKLMVFFAFKHLIRLVASQHPEPFKEVLLVTMDLVCSQSIHEHLYSSALLCLAELCHTLQVHVIAYLPRIVPSIMAISEDVDKISRNELLLLSVVTAIHRIVESLPHFLSPYLHAILLKACQLAAACPDNGNPKSPLATRLRAIRQNLAQEVSLRLLLPAIETCFEACVEEHDAAVKPLMETLGEAIKYADKNVSLWHEFLLSFFLKALDYRSNHPRESEEKIAAVEACVAEPLSLLVVKMSEASFRPFFIKFFDWATRESSSSDRALVFYFVADKIAGKLKSLFILFAGHFIRNAATLLDENNTSKNDKLDCNEESQPAGFLLVRHILNCLHKCFLYDNEGFVNKERFETLVDPLVDQIENGVECKEYASHVTDHLSPCVAQFAVAAGSDVLWKSLSYKVLLKSRHSSAKVRFAALQMVQELAKKLGEEFVTLLPETIPFLAELMEDESVEVEKLCQAVIADMEVILGEPLQKYFVS